MVNSKVGWCMMRVVISIRPDNSVWNMGRVFPRRHDSNEAHKAAKAKLYKSLFHIFAEWSEN